MGCESSNEKRHQMHNQRKNVTLSETEKAVLECKTCRDKIKKYIRNLEQKEVKAKEKAKELLKKKQKDRAKLYLKQCKLFREQTKVADGQLEMINTQIANIETTCTMAECMACLNQGNSVLKQLQKEVNIEHWENIRDDMEELKERDREPDLNNCDYKETETNENEYEDEQNDKNTKINNKKILQKENNYNYSINYNNNNLKKIHF